MSQNIRNLLHDYIESEVTDARIADAAALLSESAAGHKVPLTIKVSFEVDKDGLAAVKVGHALNLKAPEWDMPLKLDGRQMDLFAPRVNSGPPVPPPEAPPAEAAQPVVSGGAAPAVSADQASRMASISKSNESLLERVRRGELKLDPAAQAALEAQTKGDD